MLRSERFAEALFVVFRVDSKGANECTSDRSRQELAEEHLLAKIGFDTAEYESLKVCEAIRQIELTKHR